MSEMHDEYAAAAQPTSGGGLMIPSNVYDVLKPVAQVLLPGLGTLYFALAAIWGLPNAEQVVGTLAAVAVFLGLLLNLSSRSYNNSEDKYAGVVLVSEGTEPESKTVGIGWRVGSEELVKKDEVVFQVKNLEGPSPRT